MKAQKAGCISSPPRAGYFLFTGKLSARLTFSRFGCIHILNKYTVIYPAAFSVCSAGNLSASIISDARRVYSYKKWN